MNSAGAAGVAGLVGFGALSADANEAEAAPRVFAPLREVLKGSRAYRGKKLANISPIETNSVKSKFDKVDRLFRNLKETGDWERLNGFYEYAVKRGDEDTINYLLESAARYRGYDVDEIMHHKTKTQFNTFNPYAPAVKRKAPRDPRGMVYFNRTVTGARAGAQIDWRGDQSGVRELQFYLAANKKLNSYDNPMPWMEAEQFGRVAKFDSQMQKRYPDLIKGIRSEMALRDDLKAEFGEEEFFNYGDVNLTPAEKENLYAAFKGKYEPRVIDRVAEAMLYSDTVSKKKNVFQTTGTDYAYIADQGGVSVAFTYDEDNNLIPLSKNAELRIPAAHKTSNNEAQASPVNL